MAARDVEVVVKSLGQFTNRLVKQLVLDIVANLVETTPRDTGWAAANWIPVMGEAPRGVAKPPKDDPGQVAQLRTQQAGAVAAFAIGYRGGDVTIANNVPYINRLNHGHSKQAPPGFIEAAIHRALSRI